MSTPQNNTVYTRADWHNGSVLFPPEVADQIATAIIAGGAFASSLTRDTAIRGGAKAYPLINAVTGQGWVAEGAALPDVALDLDSYVVSVVKLGGIALLSRESISDSEWSLQSETARTIQDAFSRDLDTGLLTGNGTAPNPRGIMSVASAVSGPTLIAAASTALAQIGEAGGQANTLALSPTLYAATASAVDTTNRPLYPTGLTDLLGLNIVQVPGLTTPLVYDSGNVRLLVGRDFEVTASGEYSEAFKRDAVALRVTGRFNLAVPLPARSVRKLTITSS